MYVIILVCTIFHLLQMLYFNLSGTPKEVFDNVINISVINSRVNFLDSPIGSHKLDIGFVYQQPGICTMNTYL